MCIVNENSGFNFGEQKKNCQICQNYPLCSMPYKVVNQRARSRTCTLTGTSDSSIFRMATVVAGAVCTVCKVGFSSITLDIIHKDCFTPSSKVSTPQCSSYVSKSHSARKTPNLSLPISYPSCLQTTVASVLSQ